jgi:cytosine/adenosine deaminase-related metal-dependent hydrolase
MIRTMLAPGQIDTCDADMLRETRVIADRIKVPIQLHAGQSPTEYRTIRDVHGCSTIALLGSTGLLGEDFIIGHGMYLTEDGDVDHFPAAELAALVASRTTIVHLPWVKARQGAAMRSFGKFVRAGVRMGLGTDTYPFDIIQEMRCAATLSRVMDGSPVMTTSAQIFHAATVGGADALGRADLGRLAPGAKADIILIDARSPHAVPLRDPIGFIVFSATGADVDTVIVNGRTVVENRVLQTTDLDAALARLAEAAARVAARIGDRL